jgi:quercetin dioxygenase-like cupin family protein
MEPYPGVFVSSISPRDWDADPEVPGSEMHELMNADGLWAGLTRFSAVEEATLWTPQQREVIHVIEGKVRIEISGGPTIELRSGDIASLPAGLEMTWNITTPFKELWVLGPSEHR